MGADVQVVESKDADKDIKLDELTNAVTNSIIDGARSGIIDEAKGDIETATTGRFLGTLRSAAAKQFGVKTADFKDMTLEQILEKAKTAYTETTGKNAETWQKEKEQLINEYEEQLLAKDKDIETKEQEKTGIVEEWHKKFVDRDIDAASLDLLTKLPRTGGNIQTQAAMFKSTVGKNYELKYNDQTKKLEFYKDGKPAKGADGKLLTDEAVAREFLADAGILAKDTRHISPTDVKQNPQNHNSGIVDIPKNDNLAPNLQRLAGEVNG